MTNEVKTSDCDLEKAKLKLHIKYISAICIFIVAIVIAAATYNSNEFVNQVSFAGMISSIILSVIAIVMTLIGEMKSDNTKDKLINISGELENVAKDISKATSKLEYTLNTSNELSSGLNIVQEELKNLGQFISYKDIQTNDETASDLYGKKDVEDKEEIHSCYIEIFKDASIRLSEQMYKDFSLTLFYIAVKKQCGSIQIPYQEFIDDFNKLQIQLSNTLAAWNMSFLFLNASWTSDNFNNFVHQSIHYKYNNEVSKIISLMETKEEVMEN